MTKMAGSGSGIAFPGKPTKEASGLDTLLEDRAAEETEPMALDLQQGHGKHAGNDDVGVQQNGPDAVSGEESFRSDNTQDAVSEMSDVFMPSPRTTEPGQNVDTTLDAPLNSDIEEAQSGFPYVDEAHGGVGTVEEAQNGDGTEEGQAEGEEEEEEEKEPELTEQEIEELFTAVRDGDIDLVENMLNIPGADINVLWYGENLLMCAIKAGQQEMAEFLLDNGVDSQYEKILVDFKKPKSVLNDVYSTDCRQMAYDHDMHDVVDLIDELSGKAWPFRKPRQREIRLRRLPEELIESEACPSEAGEGDEDNEEGDETGSVRTMVSSVHTMVTEAGSVKEMSSVHTENSRFKPSLTSSRHSNTSGKSRVTIRSRSHDASKSELSSGYSTLSSSLSVGSLNEFYNNEYNNNGLHSMRRHRYRDTKTSISRRSVGSHVASALSNENHSRQELYMGMGSYGAERQNWAVTQTELYDSDSSRGSNEGIWTKRLAQNSQSLSSLRSCLQRSKTTSQLLERKRGSPLLPNINDRLSHSEQMLRLRTPYGSQEEVRWLPSRQKTMDLISDKAILQNNHDLHKNDRWTASGNKGRPNTINKLRRPVYTTGVKKYSPAGHVKTATEDVPPTGRKQVARKWRK